MAEASISCDPGDGVPTGLTLASYDDPDELRSALDEEASTIDSSLETLDDACQDGTTGSRKWGFGTIACLTSEDAAVVLWTDQRSKVFGRLEGEASDLADVFVWWHENARALGRPVETTPEATPKPANTKPFKRVPGDPRAISCSADQRPHPR